MSCVKNQEVARSHIRSLMVGYSHVVRSHRQIAMLKCYMDDSGSDEQPSGVFILAGYVMEELRWEDFAEKWDAQLKRDPPIDYFRMADAESGGGEFEGIDSPFRKMKVRDLALVIQSCYPTPLAVRLRWDQYNDIVKGNVPKEFENPYAILFFQTMRGNCELQIKFNNLYGSLPMPPGVEIGLKPVEFIFDEQGAITEAQCLDWYFKLRDKLPEPHRTMVGNTPRFLDDRKINPLQAADMLAWHLRRDFQFPNEKRETLGIITPPGIWERDIVEEDLREIVAAFNRGV